MKQLSTKENPKWIDLQEYKFLQRFFLEKDISFGMVYLMYQHNLNKELDTRGKIVLTSILESMKKLKEMGSEEYKWDINK